MQVRLIDNRLDPSSILELHKFFAAYLMLTKQEEVKAQDTSKLQGFDYVAASATNIGQTLLSGASNAASKGYVGLLTGVNGTASLLNGLYGYEFTIFAHVSTNKTECKRLEKAFLALSSNASDKQYAKAYYDFCLDAFLTAYKIQGGSTESRCADLLLGLVWNMYELARNVSDSKPGCVKLYFDAERKKALEEYQKLDKESADHLNKPTQTAHAREMKRTGLIITFLGEVEYLNYLNRFANDNAKKTAGPFKHADNHDAYKDIPGYDKKFPPELQPSWRLIVLKKYEEVFKQLSLATQNPVLAAPQNAAPAQAYAANNQAAARAANPAAAPRRQEQAFFQAKASKKSNPFTDFSHLNLDDGFVVVEDEFIKESNPQSNANP